MTKEEIKNEIMKCEEKLKSLREEFDKPEYGGKRWKPKKGEAFYYVDLNGAIWGSPFDIPYYVDVYAQGNCFKTRGEAKFEAERRKVIAELLDFAEDDNAIWNSDIRHWFIFYDTCDKKICCDYALIWKEAQIYFPSREAVEEAIKTVGTDRIKKYYLLIK